MINTSLSFRYNKMKRWLYVIQSILLMMCFGSVYSWSIFRLSVEDAFGVGTTLSGLPYMIFLFVYAFSMLIGGKLINQFKPRVVLIAGGIIICLGWILSSISTGIFSLTIYYGVFIGLGVGISYGVPMVVIANWFPNNKGAILGLVLAGFGLSPLITAPFGQWLLNQYGLSNTFLYYGLIYGLLIPILSLSIKLPINNTNIKKAEIVDEENQINITSHQMTKKGSFKYLYICFAIGTMIGLTIIGLTNTVGSEYIQIDSKIISKMMIIFALFNGIGRPIFGWITDRFKAQKAMLISFLLIIFASVFMLFADKGSVYIYLIAFSMLWFNLGAWLAIAPVTTMSLYGMKHYSSNYGIIFTAYGLGAVVGVISTGILIDYLGNYRIIFTLIILVSIIGIFLSRKVDKTD